MKTRKLLRHIPTGELYPLNEVLKRRHDIEVVQVREDGSVVELEDMEGVDAVDITPIKVGGETKVDEPTTKEEPVKEEPANTKPTARSRRAKVTK